MEIKANNRVRVYEEASDQQLPATVVGHIIKGAWVDTISFPIIELDYDVPAKLVKAFTPVTKKDYKFAQKNRTYVVDRSLLTPMEEN